ncbi:hypothetical protein PV755_01875 [Streptomyces caniscabiei]|uniref:Uncharacterized protein n=1 Tax=Streptomyces caniscabiei TaxID=2746961 RepID=A0A927L5J3_9ACTN|nr:hypothetical protein [Streptomyces caniscabiei]MBD9725962.1 hypothetical protein [Streptomyces caniscabiei]MDX3507684.1 hypothetical protein [Streptomyces caniscabiei]MDX3717646.1 hypothetical protein [Streptomyces caniscabiei]WEO25395.1 hypothetical protein IHE65_20615 [Streptomyces caniscabiei]
MGKGGESISDEEWERFLREAEAGSEDAPEEPSARARMVAGRLRDEPAPEPWRSHQPPRLRRGKGWYVVGLLVAVALLVVALAPGRVVGWFAGEGGESTPLAVESERPDQAPPTEAAALRPTLEQPFRGSPAARWGDGTAGLGLPEARATGWMSKKQVAQALEDSRDFLAASSLDPGVLRGERPKKAIALLNPHQQDVQDYLATAFRSPSREDDPLLLFSRFEKKVRLVGDVVKTRGRITYREGKRGAVEVTTDVSYVYPVVRAEAGSDEVARTIVRREVVMSWDDPAKIITEPGTFSLVSYKVDTTNGGCDNFTGYFTPAFDSDRETSPSGDGPALDPYDRSTSMDERLRQSDENCGTASRS